MNYIKNIIVYFIRFFLTFPAYSQIPPEYRYPSCFNGIIQRNSISMYGDSRIEAFHWLPPYTEINDRLKITKDGIGSEYEEFLRLEMQVIIQIRREIINRL